VEPAYTNCQTRGVEVHEDMACSARAGPGGYSSTIRWTGALQVVGIYEERETRCESFGRMAPGQARTRSTERCAGYLAETRRRIAVRSPLESLHDSVQYVSQGPR